MAKAKQRKEDECIRKLAAAVIIVTKPYGNFRYVAEASRDSTRLLTWSVIAVGASADALRPISRDRVPRVARRFVYQTRHRHRQVVAPAQS